MAPPPDIAELLRRHGAGEKLHPTEYGRLGAYKARVARAGQPAPATANKFYKPKPAPGAVAPAAAAPGPRPPAAPSAPGEAAPAQAQADLPGFAPVDPALVRDTTAAIIEACNGIASAFIGAEARRAGADQVSAREFEQLAKCPGASKQLMVSTSPEVVKALGIDAGSYPIGAFLTGLSIWSGTFLAAVNKLKGMQDERRRALTPEKPKGGSQDSAPPKENAS